MGGAGGIGGDKSMYRHVQNDDVIWRHPVASRGRG